MHRYTLLIVTIILSIQPSLLAGQIFHFSGLPIVGEREELLPFITVEFEVDGMQLKITLTNNTSQEILSIGENLTGLTWDITNPGVTLTPISAVVAPGARLVGVGATADTDLAGEWAFRDDISAGSSVLGPLGPFGIGAVGDINFGVSAGGDTFGPDNRFNTDPSLNLFGPPSGSLDGIGGGVGGELVDLSADGFKNQGPIVQGYDGSNTGPGQMIFNFDISGDLSSNEITNAQALFGTDGAPVAPEPSTVVMLGTATLTLLGYYWRQGKQGV